MALRTAAEFKTGLQDGRVVFCDGERVEDVTHHPDLGIAVDHVALEFRMAEHLEHLELMTWQDPDSGITCSRYFKVPGNSADLLDRREMMIERSTRLGSGVVLLVKEIGSDALLALDLVAHQLDLQCGTEYTARVGAFRRHCMESDLTMAVAQTDVKGDRSLLPSQQEHPDYFVHIVEERPDGIVVRGAKPHTTCAPYVDELIVLPTRALGSDDSAYAVAFAVPLNTPGLKLIASPLGADDEDTFHYPVSSKHRMVDSLTIFEDVFVPSERIFLKGEWQFAGTLANAFVEFHRFTAVSYKPPLCDLFIGAAALLAEFNGIERASHVREKLTKLITYAETVRGLSPCRRPCMPHLRRGHGGPQCRLHQPGQALLRQQLPSGGGLGVGYRRWIGCYGTFQRRSAESGNAAVRRPLFRRQGGHLCRDAPARIQSGGRPDRVRLREVQPAPGDPR